MIDFTKENEIHKNIIRFTIPLLLSNIVQNLLLVIEGIIVGQGLNSYALAALGIAYPIIFVVISFIVGLSIGFNIVLSQLYSLKDKENFIKTFKIIIFFLMIFGIFFTILCKLNLNHLINFFDTKKEIRFYLKNFLDYYFLGFSVFFLYNFYLSLLRAVGNSKASFFFIFFNAIIQIILYLFFIVLLKLNIEFIAISTILSQLIVFTASYVYVKGKYKFIKIDFSFFKMDKNSINRILKISIPPAFQQFFVALSNVIISFMAVKIGTESITAYTIASRLELLILMPIINIAYSLSVFVSHNIVNENFKIIKKGYLFVRNIGTIFSFSSSILLIIFGKQLAFLFVSNTNIANLVKTYFIFVSIFYVVFNYLQNMNAILRGSGYTFIPMLITVICLVVIRIPLTYYLAITYGFKGLCTAIPSTWLLSSLLLFIAFKKDKWKKSSVANFDEFKH